jgi:glucose 1-dehydrogenase
LDQPLVSREIDREFWMNMLAGRHAFVTGSTQGIGLEIAIGLRDAGASVILHGTRMHEAAVLAAEKCRTSAGPANVVVGDLAEPMPESPVSIAEQALRLNPSIDTLVCNAGTFIDAPFLEMDFATFDRTLKLNVYSQFVLIQHFARRWAAQKVSGRVLLIGSINGKLAEQTHVAYDTSKGAIDAMVRSLCVSLAPIGIRVNGVAPGLLWTRLTEPALKNDKFRRWMEVHTPNGKVPQADACTGAAVFLLSDAADHIHGQMLYVDGGMSTWQQPDPPEEWLRGE